MDDNYGKLWLQKTTNQLAVTRAQQAIKSLGRALPCRVTAVSGAIVTVAFEVNAAPWNLPQITIPKAESPWIRMPTQVGDKGVTMPADVYLGGVSGLGGGVASMLQRGNLSALVFVPVSNANSGPIDQNAAQIQGPNGAIIRTTTGTTSSIVTNDSGTTITFGTTTLTVNAAGITLTVGGQTFTWGGAEAVSTLPIQAPDVILPNGAVNEHYHPGVQTGSGNTGTMTG
ncbi:hypothetical protein [Paraburkholderia sp. J11-2]|uniref:hypothetical protein n=1 Tax=Paraburkholderia sp. J11-2 TaxID=2805431 RepID=UPI002AB5E875|nr:hypothetical protein [Paraburkholderia sp. J11-2]